jgi:hypothetical protein
MMKIKSYLAALITLFLLILYPHVGLASWKLMPGLATDIGVGGGSVWVTGNTGDSNGYSIFRWERGNWQHIDGSAVAISVDSNGRPWVVNRHGDIFYRDYSWHKLPGAARDIAVGGDNNSVWVIGVERTNGGYQIFHWNGYGWDKVDGGGVHIAVDPDGKPWVVNENGDIFRFDGHGWHKMPGGGTDIGIGGDGTVWVIGTDSQNGGYGIHKLTGSHGWRKVDGGAIRIAVEPNGNPWVVNDDGNIYKFTH